MIDVDTNGMAASARKLFVEAVQAYAKAIRSGSEPAMQSARNLMGQASQAQIMSDEHLQGAGAIDPET